MRPVIVFFLAALVFYGKAQERRLALIVGNSAYHQKAVLKNTVNDARAMEEALQQLGFTTIRHENLGLNDFKKAIDDFGRQLPAYHVGLFYYAGHGVQYKGRNYLIPVDADLQVPQQIEFDCVPAERVLAFMEGSGTAVNIMILDACRNNPFENGWNRSVYSSGLASINAPSGSIIAFSTSPGKVASDGAGENGLYTGILLKHIRTPNLTIEQVFKRVRLEMEQVTASQQVPWESTSLKGDFFFLRDSTFTGTFIHPGSISSGGSARELNNLRRHALRLQGEIPVQLGLGYEYHIKRWLSVSLQSGWLSKMNSLMMFDMMGAFGDDQMSMMIRKAYDKGLVFEAGFNYHFKGNYIGIFGQQIMLRGAAATAEVENNFDTDVSLWPVKPGRPETAPASIELNTDLYQAGILYGRILPLKNPDWQVRLEFTVSKNFASSTRLYSPDRDLSSFERQADQRLDSWFARYGYVPSLSIALTRVFGRTLR